MRFLLLLLFGLATAESAHATPCGFPSDPICDDSNPCTTDTCNVNTATCDHVPANDGLACNDGNACTQTDTCVAGACVGTNPVADGTACSDGNACTQTDTCQAGVCTGANPVVCAAPDQCHNAGTCDPASGLCSNPAKTNGTTCADGNACTQTDTCQAGICTGASPVVCTASDQCHNAGTCNSASGTCSNPAKTNGTACSDGNRNCFRLPS